MPAQSLQTHSQAVGLIAPSLRAIVRDGDSGLPKNLTGYTAPTFTMIGSDNVAKISAASAVIEDAPNGVVRYDWSAGDVDTAGRFHGFFLLVNAASKNERFPVGKKLLIEIL